jgi:hypothetical protein
MVDDGLDHYGWCVMTFLSLCSFVDNDSDEDEMGDHGL